MHFMSLDKNRGLIYNKVTIYTERSNIMKEIKSESRLSFFEATAIIVGHGVGSGILSVPFLASRNSFREVLWIIAFCYLFNVVLHLIIAELSYNNGGAQFVKCMDAELFSGPVKTVLTWTAFIMLGLSVIFNVSGFLTGAAAVGSKIQLRHDKNICPLLFRRIIAVHGASEVKIHIRHPYIRACRGGFDKSVFQ